MTVTDDLEKWVEEHGSERDALNVALARLSAARFKLNALQDATLYMDCPKCGGIYLPHFVCFNCGYDSGAGK